MNEIIYERNNPSVLSNLTIQNANELGIFILIILGLCVVLINDFVM
jgi:hypothetical protein